MNLGIVYVAIGKIDLASINTVSSAVAQSSFHVNKNLYTERANASDPNGALSVFDAVNRQLGLKLKRPNVLTRPWSSITLMRPPPKTRSLSPKLFISVVPLPFFHIFFSQNSGR